MAADEAVNSNPAAEGPSVPMQSWPVQPINGRALMLMGPGTYTLEVHAAMLIEATPCGMVPPMAAFFQITNYKLPTKGVPDAKP